MSTRSHSVPRGVLKLLRVIGRVGWIVPMWASANSLIHWFQTSRSDVLHSFPYLSFSRQMLLVGVVWLTIVLCLK